MLQYIRNVAQYKKEEGASAVEYGLLVAAIAAVIVLIVFALGHLIHDVFGSTCSKVSTGSGVTSTANCGA